MGLKIGLIGGGFMSGVHRGNLDRDDRVEVCGVYDIDPTRAGALAVAS